MATKPPHVQDNVVVERRLRPIYDWLDSANNKKAYQECQKVLKKTPNLHCAKALKALTLLRMGKEDESVAILDALAAATPTDEATLQAMTLCCRELQQLDRICRMFENALKIDPSNEELNTSMFMAYVRVYDFKAQHQCAMNLYKQKAKNPYYCWAVMSIVLQATRGEGKTDPAKRQLLLCLAERMMAKLLGEGKLEAEQEVQLYTMILELQEKYEEILKLLDGPLEGKMLHATSQPDFLINYLLKMGRWKEINLKCKAALYECVDRWNLWKIYIESVLKLMDDGKPSSDGDGQMTNHTNDNHTDVDGDRDRDDEGENEVYDDTPEKAHEFICGIVEEGCSENGYLLRGPYLARFELCSKLKQKGVDTSELLGDMLELFIEYFRKFGHKPCCVNDLIIYLNLLNKDKRLDLASRLLKDVGISATSVPQSLPQMQRHISALKLSRLLGQHLVYAPDHLRALVTALALHYQHGYQAYGASLLSTDVGPSDSYALLAAHLLYDLAQTEQRSRAVVVALALLERVVKNSPGDFQAKLLAVRLYHTIGGIYGANEMYNSLDIKHLQLDSLGYIHCGRLQTTGLFTMCSNFYDMTLKFFSSNYKDSTDHLTFSYKFGSFSKLEEFMDFRERLNNSLHYATVAVDRLILGMLMCPSLDTLYSQGVTAKESHIDWEHLRDNRDLSVLASWDPSQVEAGVPPEQTPETKRLFKQDVEFLRLRVHVIWLMIEALEIAKAPEKGAQNRENISRLTGDWERLYQEVILDKELCIPLYQSHVTVPLPSRLHLFLSCSYVSILGKLFRMLTRFAVEDESKTEKEEEARSLSKEVCEEVERLVKSARNTIELCNDLLQVRVAMEYVVNTVEILCLSSLICALCNEIMKSLLPNKSKGKKKVPISASPRRELLSSTVASLKGALEATDALLGGWSVEGFGEEDKSEVSAGVTLEALGLNDEEGRAVLDRVRESHEGARRELQGALRWKVKLLGGLFGG